MAEPEPDHDTSNSIQQWDLTRRVRVNLPESVRGNLRMLRWLHHWVVDAMADRGYVQEIVDDVEKRLGYLGADIVGTSVSDLVRQARAATSKPKKRQAPKKVAKRKRK